MSHDTVTRLRKTFRFLGDEETTEPNEGIDEQEQETVIENLKADDAKQITLYRRVLMILPPTGLLLYPFTLPITSTLYVTCLAILSVCVSFITVYDLTTTFPPSKDDECADVKGHDIEARLYVRVIQVVRKRAMYFNAGICMMLVLLVFTTAGFSKHTGLGGGHDDLWWRQLAIPLVLYMVTSLARYELRPLDVKELERLRYDYKGA